MESQFSIRAAPKGFGGLLRNIGPGVVVSGSVVGSGELLVTTRMGADVGFVFLWGVIVAAVVKYFIQLELGRQCILRGDTTIQALNRLPGLRLCNTSWIAWLCIIGYLCTMLALVGILSAVAGLMVTIMPAISLNVWATIIFILLSILLYRGLYNDLEKMVTFLVAAFSVIVIGSVLMVQGTPYAITGAQLASGFHFAMPAEGAFVALAVMGSVGATAVELFMYPYWIKEKGYPAFVGERDQSAEWEERYRGWMRVVTTDAGVCTIIALAITCAYYLLGASILNKLNVQPQGFEVVNQVSHIFTESIGLWAKGLFMFGAFCTLFSTLLVFAASSGRIGADFLHQIGVGSLDTSEARTRMIRILQIGFALLWLILLVIYATDQPFVLLLMGANANNLLLIPLAYGILHLAMTTVSELRMSIWVEIGLMVTIWVIVNFTAINLYLKWTG
jgi:Mn2+/Fe2+ NRAMP family transporter